MYFDGFFLSKAYNVSARKFQRNCVSWHWRVMKNLKENWLVAWKMTRNSVNFHASSRKSENLHFHGLLLSKAYKVLDEKVQKNMSHDTEEWCKVWRKTDSCFQKWRGIWWILTQVVESLKIAFWWGYFCQKYVIFELKKRGVESWKMTYVFKNDK